MAGAEFNSLDNQREASEAYVKGQFIKAGAIRTHTTMALLRRLDGQAALQRRLDDVRARRIDVIVVYKVDR